MMPLVFKKIYLFILTVTFITIGGNGAVAIEEVPYTVIEKNKAFELRQYSPHIVAETTVEGAFDQVGSEGFRRLADYINGENRLKQSIGQSGSAVKKNRHDRTSGPRKIGRQVAHYFCNAGKICARHAARAHRFSNRTKAGARSADGRCALFRHLEPQGL